MKVRKNEVAYQLAYEAVLAFAGSELGRRVGAFLKWAEEYLRGSWQDHGDAANRLAMQSTEQWLKQDRAKLAGALQQRLVLTLTNQLQGEPSIHVASLQLLEENALKVVLARAKLVNRVMDLAQSEVHMLEARLDALRQSGHALNPMALAPGSVVDGLIIVMGDLGVPNEVQGTMLEICRCHGVERLVNLYQTLNQLLATYDVQPVHGGQDSKSRDTSAKLDPAQMVHAMDSQYEAIQSVLAKVPMQDWRPNIVQDAFKGGVTQKLTPAQSQSLRHVDAMISDFMGDPKISSRIRDLIGRLVLPLVRARLAEPEEFAVPDNPTRMFMRQLAILGYRDQEFPLKAIESVKVVVDRLIAEKGMTMNSFYTGAAALYTITKMEVRQRFTMTPEDLTKVWLGGSRPHDPLSRSEEARTQVIIELREHMAGLDIPEAIQRFVTRLLGPWMLVRLMRYGERSAQWFEARTFAAVLFDVLRPAVSEADHKRKCSTRNFALRQMRLRTERSKMPPEEAQTILENVGDYFKLLDATPEVGIVQHAEGASDMAFLYELPQVRIPPTGRRRMA